MKHPDATLLEQRLSKACPTTQHAAIIMARRDAVGVQKYGQTVDENPLSAGEWAHHAVEEAADGLKYAIRAREEAEKLEMEVQAMRTANAALVERVKRLEEAGDVLARYAEFPFITAGCIKACKDWNNAKGQP
jgi:hypothetical protein